MVVDRVLQDALEHERQLLGRAVGIFLRELEHRVLDDVERGVLVADGVHRLLERAALDLGEKRESWGKCSRSSALGLWAGGL